MKCLVSVGHAPPIQATVSFVLFSSLFGQISTGKRPGLSASHIIITGTGQIPRVCKGWWPPTVRHEATEISTDNTVPCWSLAFVKLFIHIPKGYLSARSVAQCVCDGEAEGVDRQFA